MKKIPWNYFLGAGLLLSSAALLLGGEGWIPHGLKLFMMGIGSGVELYGVYRKCRKEREQ